MPDFRCTWFFEGVQSQAGTTSSSMVGWTETWYGTFAGIEEALIEMRNTGTATSYLTTRLACMSSLYRAVWVRASSVTNPRYTKTAGLANHLTGIFGKNAEDPEGSAAQVNCAVLADLVALPQVEGDRNHHRRFLIRGLPRVLIRGNVINEGSPAFTAMLAFLNVVGRGRAPVLGGGAAVPIWKMRVHDAAFVKANITALATAVGNPKRLVIDAGLPNSAVGTRLEVSRVKSPRGVNRIWTIVGNTAGGPPYTVGTSRFDIAGDWDGNGQAQLSRYLYAPANQYIVIGLRNKRIGVPFRLTRGRRQAS